MKFLLMLTALCGFSFLGAVNNDFLHPDDIHLANLTNCRDGSRIALQLTMSLVVNNKLYSDNKLRPLGTFLSYVVPFYIQDLEAEKRFKILSRDFRESVDYSYVYSGQALKYAISNGVLATCSSELLIKAESKYPNAFNSYRSFLNKVVPFGIATKENMHTLETFALRSVISSLLLKSLNPLAATK